jgi:hypothetical protein
VVLYGNILAAFHTIACQHRFTTMAALSTLLLSISLALLMVISIIELSFISSTVSFLHRRAGGQFNLSFVYTNPNNFPIHGKPLHFLLNQGHTSNGAAGTAFVLIGIGGILVLTARKSARFSRHHIVKMAYYAWIVFTILSALLTLAALIFTFIVTDNHKGQSINVFLASSLYDQPYPHQRPYPADEWTPENWFAALLATGGLGKDDASELNKRLRICRGWRWNLVPMFIFGVAVAGCAIWDVLASRKNVWTSGKQEKDSGSV